MATVFEVVLPAGVREPLSLAEDALDLIDRLEAQLTVYRDSSEVSRLNRLAPFTRIPVEKGLYELLQLSAQLSEETEGAFDITAGALVKAWGFFRGPRRVPSASELTEALARTGSRHVVLHEEDRSVQYLCRGLEINLGAIGKGYALDRVAARLEEVPAVLLHGGYSSVYAKGYVDDSRGWEVGITHPSDPGCRIGTVRLRDRALGTSAASVQFFEHRGKRYGHILDPRTGWPASRVASASVLAPTSAEADALSTAFFIGGLEMAARYCSARPEVGAIILPQGSRELFLLGTANEHFTPF
jgi:thiamine biosynthesis lipoprotein